MQLKQSYDRVKHIREQSGWGWNYKKNLPRVKDDVWNKYVKVSDIALSYAIVVHIYAQAHPKAKQWCTKPFPFYDNMAELVEGSRASGTRKYRPKKPTDKETPGQSPILIDPILIAESISQGKLYSDSASDSEVCSLSSAPSTYLHISRMMLARTKTKIIPTQTTNPKERRRVL